MHLIIANKAYSSWSMRPWLVMTAFGIPFDETVIPLRQPDTASRILAVSPSGKVPVLIDDDGSVIWESLAIIEHLAEAFPDRPIWPQGRARGTARAVAAEMHGGFLALRQACPMNLRRPPAPLGLSDAAKADVARICGLWQAALTESGGPFLFGDFGAADAMYAPVAARLYHYAVDVPDVAATYVTRLRGHSAYRAWQRGAEAEPWIITEYDR